MKVSSKLPAIQRQIDALENAGFKIRLHHNSHAVGYIRRDGKIYEFTGKTAIEFEHPDWNVYAEAKCSVNDHFDRSVGTKLAFQRAINDLGNMLGRNGMKEIFGGN